MLVLIHLKSPKRDPRSKKLCDFIYGEEDFPADEGRDPRFYEVGYNQRVMVPYEDIAMIEKGVIFPKDDSNVWVLN